MRTHPAFRTPHAHTHSLCRLQIVHALGLAFHDNHFQCIKCEQSLADVKFFAHAGMPYCGDCFNEMHSPTCAGCKKPVVQVRDTLQRLLRRAMPRAVLLCS